MVRFIARALIALTLVSLAAAPAHAVLHAGDVAPDFHKTALDGSSQTLSQYQGKVVVMFVLGWN